MLSDRIKTIRSALLKHLEIADLGHSSGSLKSWFDSDFGAYIGACEERIIRAEYAQLPGYRLLSLGVTGDLQARNHFAQLHRFSLHPSDADGQHAALANYHQLPIPSGVVDVALMQHGLEFSASPKAALAEVCRVIMPGGHLLLCVFNPFGIHGGIKWLMQLLTNRPQYRFHNLRANRLADWLSLLSFQVLDVHYGAFSPIAKSAPKQSELAPWQSLCERANLPFGNVYIMHAVKRETQGIGRRSTRWPKPAHGYGHRRMQREQQRGSAPNRQHKFDEDSNATS